MDTLDSRYARRFFSEITGDTPQEERPASLVITHLLSDRPFFLEATNKVTEIVGLMPKPKTENPEARAWLQHRYPIFSLRRDMFNQSEKAIAFIASRVGDRPFVLVDIGGYYSSSLTAISEAFGGKLLGVVEDTENGLQRYESLRPLPCRVYQVARSPLKNPEDFLVGQSIVFSTEALLREQGDILHGRTACVIGYGKLGRSIANLLHSRHVRVVVYDTDPVTSVEALSHGFTVAPSLRLGLKNAGLVFCATGNLSLRLEDVQDIEHGAYIATVTSSDDELQFSDLTKTYEVNQRTEYVTRYTRDGHTFHILNRGQAVNFIHGAAVGPFIYLVQAEIVAAIQELMSSTKAPGVYECPRSVRERIAKAWVKYYAPTD